MAFGEDFGQLLANAFRRNLVDMASLRADGLKRARLDRKLQSRREPHRAQHAELVFFETLRGIADGAQKSCLQVISAAYKVQNAIFEAVAGFICQRIQQQAVDGEVPAENVFARIGRKAHRIGAAAIAVHTVVAKGRNLGGNAFAIALGDDQHNTEVCTHSLSPLEGRLHLIRGSRGADVEVFRRNTEQQIAHAAASEIRSKTALAKALCNVESFGVLRAVESCHGYSMRCMKAEMALPFTIDLVPTGLILGIESSCDETSVSIVRNGRDVLANVVASQLIHSDYGGVVPELASREHLRNIVPVLHEALATAGVGYDDLDALAVTEGPGLAGALLVGITFAKALALGRGLPLIGVNHLEGHIHAVLMDAEEAFAGATTLLALVVSGGHTHLYLAARAGQAWQYRNVGKTLDDAAGEAYDKVAKLLGLPYPGGPWMDALAAHGVADRALFPFAQIKQKATGNTAPKLAREAVLTAEDDPTRFDMSFSGIKTAVRRYVELNAMQPEIAARAEAFRALGLDKAKPTRENIAAALPHFDARTLNLIASFQNAVVKNLTRSTFNAAKHFGAQGILVSGGVSANSYLRSAFAGTAKRDGLPIAFPQVALSTDNAAMIAAAAWPKWLARTFAPDTLEPTPQLRLG